MNRIPNDKEKNGVKPSYNASGNSVRRPAQGEHTRRPNQIQNQNPVTRQPAQAQRPQEKSTSARANQAYTKTPPAKTTKLNPTKKAEPKERKQKPIKSKEAKIPAPVQKKPIARSRKNDFIKPTDVVRIKGSYDKLFLILVIILTLFGIIMDFSASYAYAFSRYGDSFYFVKRQILFACIGMIPLIVAMNFDYRWLRKVTVPIFIVAIILLLAVLMYGIASGVAQRWIMIGSYTFQPSEVMKPALVFMLALYVARNQDRITNYRNKKQSFLYGMLVPFLIVGVVCLLIALERHISGTIIVFAIGAVVIFAAGASMKWFMAAVISACSLIGVAIAVFPYAQDRINMLLHPESYDPTGKIWQTLQGLYAIGSGGLFGVGLGNSRQKHMYVSQPQNDFVFSIIAEELGFAGAALVIILFMLLIWRGFVIALKAPDTFSSLVVIGLISKVAIQALLNIAVVTNMIPNTGISLPFFSYGGTALIVQLAEMGVILSISKYSYQKKDALDQI